MNHKNSAYQRGASRQQPQPTAPSVAAAPAQKSLPGWLWLACGMIIGTCTVFLMNLNSGGEADKAPEAAIAPAGSAETAPAQVATQADEPHKPKYDFYTLLPDSKVILPPNMEEETVATPAPAAVPSEADRAEAALAAGSAAAVAAAALAHKATDTSASQSQSSMALKPPVPAVTVTTNTQPKQPPAPPVVKPTPVAKVTPPPVPSTPVAKVVPPPVQPTVTPPPTQAKLQSPPPVAPAPAPAKSQQLFLQAGSYRSADDADRMRAEMLLMGVNARVEKSLVRGETWHRVLVGPYSNQDKMSQARKQLTENGFSGLIPQRR